MKKERDFMAMALTEKVDSNRIFTFRSVIPYHHIGELHTD